MKLRIERLTDYSAPRLAAEMLSAAANIAPADIYFYRSQNGKPLCDLPLHFNCSHSGDYVACAVSAREIGIDLERIRPVHDRLLRTLTPEEAAWLRAQPEQNTAFFRLWTMKESWLKCHGGTLLDYRRCNFADANGALQTHFEGRRFTFPPAPAGYLLTLCVKE